MADDLSEFRRQHLIETYKALPILAGAALKTIILLNGAAAIALIARLDPRFSAGGSMGHIKLTTPIRFFVVGIFLGGLAHIFAYLTQLALYDETLARLSNGTTRLTHRPWLWATIAIVVLSAVMFLWGALVAAQRLR